MYGKLFEQMYDGTLGTKGPWQALVTFQQLIILADKAGNVDMTPEAISRRTTIPVEVIRQGIEALEQPDPESRSPALEGRRIVRLSEGRGWGWQIVNYAHYRAIRSQDERREYMRLYQRERRARVNKNVNSSTASEQNQPIAVSSRQYAVSNKEEKTKAEAPQRSRGSRLQPDWEPDPTLLAWASNERPDLDIAAVVEGFRDFWIAKPGKDGTKLDWPATFRNWVRNQRSAKPGLPQAGSAPRPTIQCRSCGNRVSTWTGHQCDPCWRKSQGMDNPLAGLQ